MDSLSTYCYTLFCRSITDYHMYDDVDRPIHNPYPENSRDCLLYAKNWIDTVQWHLEDMVRDPEIDCGEGLRIKRRIDRLNQQRTDTVEQLDDHFLGQFIHIVPSEDARCNTESLGWALDRLSILALKEFHMDVELNRKDVLADHLVQCRTRKEVLSQQRYYLMYSIDSLIRDIRTGKAVIKVYKQMKMYNDSSLNPVLYGRRAFITSSL